MSHKRKVNANNVTHTAWVTKKTSRGPQLRRVVLDQKVILKSPVAKNQSTPKKTGALDFTPSKCSRSGSKWTFDGNSFDEGPNIEPIQLRVKNSPNEYLRNWYPHKDEFLEVLLEMEAPPDHRKCSLCPRDGTYRCLGCFGQPLYCTNCCREQHHRSPFHRIEQWTGSFFEDSALIMTGLELHLGHGGASCPSAHSGRQPTPSAPTGPIPMNDDQWEDLEPEPEPREMPCHLKPPSGKDYITVVDVSGLHFLTVNFCTCHESPAEYRQLLECRLFPATLKTISTVFTFRVLDDFIRDNLECGTSGMNYFNKLRRVTSNVFPHLVPDRYHELLRVARQWRLLKLLKWNGFGHRTRDAEKGELALFCPTCPQPGINVEGSEAELSHWKYTRTFVMDGNFKAEHLQDKNPEDQVWLMDGLGYMVSRPEYQKYLKVTNHPLERSACNNHRAVNQANASHGRLEATGIGATACARHGCFVPHSVVDFQKGERQVNMDYSLTNALRHNTNGISRAISFYDVNCAYIKKFRSRVNKSEFIEMPTDLEIIPGIGIWHVHGAGWVDGEVIETLWSVLNIVSGSTRGMSSPHRQELLDFQMNDSNFVKMIRMTGTLARKISAARRNLVIAREAFHDIDMGVAEPQKEEWLRQEQNARDCRLTDPSSLDIYDVQLKKAKTLRAVEIEILQDISTSGDIPRGAATWLSKGLKIQEAQIALGRDLKSLRSRDTDVKKLAIVRRGDKLAAEIAAYLSEAPAYIAEADDDELHSDVPTDEYSTEHIQAEYEVTDQRPEEAVLPLPSTLGLSQCRTLGAEKLISVELSLRIGQANDALHEIRLALADKSVLFRTEVRHAKSQAKTTRAWGKVNSADAIVGRHAATYRKCRLAMVNLGADEAVLARYEVLKEEHLKVSTAVAKPNVRDDKNNRLAWFWKMDIPRDTEMNDWMSEFYRVHWLRAKATLDRRLEEEELLLAEFQWTGKFFDYKAKIWSRLAARSHRDGRNGGACYASQQHAVYSRLRENCLAERQNFRPSSLELSHDVNSAIVL